MACRVCGCETNETICPDCSKLSFAKNGYALIAFGIALLGLGTRVIDILRWFVAFSVDMFFDAWYFRSINIVAFTLAIVGLVKRAEYNGGRRFAIAAVVLSSIAYLVL